jgi:hypothetical protein
VLIVMNFGLDLGVPYSILQHVLKHDSNRKAERFRFLDGL